MSTQSNEPDTGEDVLGERPENKNKLWHIVGHVIRNATGKVVGEAKNRKNARLIQEAHNREFQE